MEHVNIALILDGLIIVMMFSVLLYLFKTSRLLSRLGNSKGELNRLLSHFSMATQRAEESIKSLKMTGQKTVKTIDTVNQKARRLHEDLTYLIERGNGLADELELSLSHGRKIVKKRQNGASAATERKDGEAVEDLVKGLHNLR